MSADTLSDRALNRATLQRQHLLNRTTDMEETIEHVIGFQAQNPLDPYLALWCRIENFDPAQLSELLLSRAVVRAALMRGTIHLVTSHDYRRLQPAFAPVLERVFNSTGFAKDIAGADRSEITRLAREMLTTEPITRVELGQRLQETWPDLPAASLAQTATYLVPVIQTTPRGVWGARSVATWTTALAWLGDENWTPEPIEETVIRYLGAFGPASITDIRTWSGLTAVAEIVDGMRHRLRVWQNDEGQQLFDLPDAPHPDPDVPAPPRLLPEYDNVLLAHSNRARFFPDGTTLEGWTRALLVDGCYAGTWTLEESRSAIHLDMRPRAKLSRAQRDEVESEAYRLLAALYGDKSAASVRIS